MFEWAKGVAARRHRDSSAAEEAIRQGNRLLGEGDLAGAAASYALAVAADPDQAAARLNLGFILQEMGRDTEACSELEQALHLDPRLADAHYFLGRIAERRQEPEAAIRHYEAAIALKPDFTVVYADLCRAYFHADRFADAKRIIERGVALDPDAPALNFYLGNVRMFEKAADKAIACYRKVLAAWPDSAMAHTNLGKAYMELGEVDEAVAIYRRALMLGDKAAEMEARSALLFARSYRLDDTPAAYLAEAREYGALVAQQAQPYRAWNVIRDGGSPLRVGMVSGDFLLHPVGHFLESILASLDPARLELVAYPTVAQEDALTARIKPCFSAWHSLAALDDAAAAARIHADGIQVLIDLSGHTSHNRLPLFAWKPAPVQVSWLGYFASTGVPGMDYLLADPYSVPEQDRARYSETVWYLPDTRLCFTPPTEAAALDAAPLPALRDGRICFGCFQNVSKLNDRVLATWGRILGALPQARLRVQNKQLSDPGMRDGLLARCMQAGIDPARVTMNRPGSRAEYLAAHAEVDMVLDTFPYPGGTTTCEALWMGVPTLTLAGATMLERQGAAMMQCVGLDDWVAADIDDYVARAVSFAGRLDELAQLRRGLREQAARSPLFDAPRFARNLEEAILAMWRRHLDR